MHPSRQRPGTSVAGRHALQTSSRTLGITISALIFACLLSGCAEPRTADINPEQRLHIARAAEGSGDGALARTMYASAAEASHDRGQQLRAADGLSRMGDPAAAMRILEGILARSSADLDARRRLGSLQISNGQSAEAARDLTFVLAAHPEDDASRINLGVALDLLGRHAEAQPLYRAVLGRLPSDMDAANDLALSLSLSGQPDQARAVLSPFLGRRDMPERMRATANLVGGTGNGGGAAVPIPLYPRGP